MSHTTMSLPALYEYAKDVLSVDIFSGLTVPADIDRGELINWILHRSAPFEVTYPNPNYLQFAIGSWAKINARTFQKWVDAFNIKYDPLNNYDRTEEYTESGIEAKGRDNKTGSTSVSSNRDDTKTDTDTTNQVSPFDSSTWNNTDKTTTGSETGTTSSAMQRLDGTEKEQENKVDSRQHKLRAFGNVGVTTSQQMLQSELDIAAWNIYEHIVDMFIDEFCVLLY